MSTSEYHMFMYSSHAYKMFISKTTASIKGIEGFLYKVGSGITLIHHFFIAYSFHNSFPNRSPSRQA